MPLSASELLFDTGHKLISINFRNHFKSNTSHLQKKTLWKWLWIIVWKETVTSAKKKFNSGSRQLMCDTRKGKEECRFEHSKIITTQQNLKNLFYSISGNDSLQFHFKWLKCQIYKQKLICFHYFDVWKQW